MCWVTVVVLVLVEGWAVEVSGEFFSFEVLMIVECEVGVFWKTGDVVAMVFRLSIF